LLKFDREIILKRIEKNMLQRCWLNLFDTEYKTVVSFVICQFRKKLTKNVVFLNPSKFVPFWLTLGISEHEGSLIEGMWFCTPVTHLKLYNFADFRKIRSLSWKTFRHCLKYCFQHLRRCIVGEQWRTSEWLSLRFN